MYGVPGCSLIEEHYFSLFLWYFIAFIYYICNYNAEIPCKWHSFEGCPGFLLSVLVHAGVRSGRRACCSTLGRGTLGVLKAGQPSRQFAVQVVARRCNVHGKVPGHATLGGPPLRGSNLFYSCLRSVQWYWPYESCFHSGEPILLCAYEPSLFWVYFPMRR